MVEEFRQAHEPNTVHGLDNERIKIVPPLLAIADDIHSGLFLQGYSLLDGLGHNPLKRRYV
jgi:hypothetical protein